MYYRTGEKLSILMAYVDDILLTGNNHDEITHIKRKLLRKYEGRDFGAPQRILGVNISIPEQDISLKQLYAESIVTEGMGSVQVRGASTPLEPGIDMTARRKDEETLDGNIYSYPTLVGKLIFLAGCQDQISPTAFVSSGAGLSHHAFATGEFYDMYYATSQHTPTLA
ncbi:unnamed protein product [Discosporangium mesarthrocarpum]